MSLFKFDHVPSLQPVTDIHSLCHCEIMLLSRMLMLEDRMTEFWCDHLQSSCWRMTMIQKLETHQKSHILGTFMILCWDPYEAIVCFPQLREAW